MGCPFDENCKYWNEKRSSSKCLPCKKWEGHLNQPVYSPQTIRMDLTEIPLTKNPDYVLSVIRTLPEKQATVLIQKNYLRYTNLQIKEYHGFKTESAVSNIIQRATKNVLKKLKWHK